MIETRDALVAIIYPRSCEVCGSLIESLDCGPACRTCWAGTRARLRDPLCLRCGFPAPEAAHVAQIASCSRCADKPYDLCRSIGLYEGALKAAIIELKTRPVLPAAFKELLLAAFDRETLLRECDCAVPVPLHRNRERERGFNQALVIAEALSKARGIAVERHLLTRVRDTARHRAGMDARDRARSAEGAFHVALPQLAESRSILLLDDVYTTGATVSACSAVLKKAGAARVIILAAARVA